MSKFTCTTRMDCWGRVQVSSLLNKCSIAVKFGTRAPLPVKFHIVGPWFLYNLWCLCFPLYIFMLSIRSIAGTLAGNFSIIILEKLFNRWSKNCMLLTEKPCVTVGFANFWTNIYFKVCLQDQSLFGNAKKK